MMGHSHAVSGVAAGMALFGTATLSIPPLGAGSEVTTIPLGAGVGDLSLTQVVAASLIMGVTALLPDIDSPSSSVATALPGVTRPISRVIAKGGHRTWTHSLIGFVIAAFLTYDVTFWTVTVNGVDVRPGNGIVLGLLLAVAARALGVTQPGGDPVVPVPHRLRDRDVGPGGQLPVVHAHARGRRYVGSPDR